MSTSGREQDEAMRAISTPLLAFARFFEQLQQDIDFRRPQSAQQQLREQADGLLAPLAARLASTLPGGASQAAHLQLGNVLEVWTRAVTRLLAGSGPDFGLAFIESRRLWCEGLALAYGLRGDFPDIDRYWLTAAHAADGAALDRHAADNRLPVGVMQVAADGEQGGYALYVPESYTATRAWPLIVCLHGAYGHGHEYLWTWLRVARSEGCLVLAPKSRGPTWSLLEPDIDITSIRAMMEALAARYRIDAQRVLLSGLSDGGSFAYVAGLSCPSLFSAVAPVAGVLHPVADRLLRAKQGIAMPLLVVHGAQDFIFDVRAVRSQCGLLDKLGYRLTYTELPDWGHAYTDGINERLVWPWFAALNG